MNVSLPPKFYKMSKIVYLTRRERFNAAHKLSNEAWDDAKNLEIFGKCANPNWHGHNYDLFVTVKGEPNPETGYCMDLKVLSELLGPLVVDKLDHKNLNLDVARPNNGLLQEHPRVTKGTLSLTHCGFDGLG